MPPSPDPIEEYHKEDENGYPAGGHSLGRGITVEWQDGPLVVDGKRRAPTGAFVEDVIRIAIGRMEFYQGSRFHCIHNSVALGNLYAALEVLTERTRDREARGVEGTHNV